MADLDTLRPEVMEAAAKLDDFDSAFGTGGHWQIIRAELLQLATRNAELEAKATRDHDWISDLLAENKKAEAELAALKSQPFRGRAQDAIDRFAGGEELSHEEMCEVVNQAVCAERELAALKARIAGSSVVKIANYGDPFIVLPDHFTVPNSLKGKTVRLVVEE